MRNLLKFPLLAVALAVGTASAAPVMLDFEDGAQLAELAGNRYQASAGASFGNNAWLVGSQLNNCGGVFLFTRTNSCGALLVVEDFFAPGQSTDPIDVTLTIGQGFVDAINFVYSTKVDRGAGGDLTVNVFDANGNSLLDNGPMSFGDVGDCLGVQFCNWQSGSLKFSGVARYVTFSGNNGNLMLDDIGFNTPASGATGVPEPATLALSLGALGMAAASRRRKVNTPA